MHDIGAFMFLVGIFGVIALALFLRNREGERRHAERLKAMELGVALPPIPPEPVRHRRRIALSVGILSLCLATAFWLLSQNVVTDHTLHGHDTDDMVIPATILTCLGIGFILIHIFHRNGNGNGQVKS